MAMICGNCGGSVEPHASECSCYLTLNDKSMEPKEKPKAITLTLKEQIEWISQLSPNDIMAELNDSSGLFMAKLGNVYITLIQKDNFQAELQVQNELNVKLGKALDSSQEEVKRLKEALTKARTERIEELELRVKELTELVKEAWDIAGDREYNERFGPVPNPIPSKAEWLKSKGL